MRFERASSGRRRPGLTPLIDVVFLLLIFFMLATRLADDHALRLEQVASAASPQTGPAASPDAETSALELELRADGTTRLDGEPVAALEPALRDRLEHVPPDAAVRVTPDPSVPLQRIATTLETVARAGGRRVSLVERRP